MFFKEFVSVEVFLKNVMFFKKEIIEIFIYKSKKILI